MRRLMLLVLVLAFAGTASADTTEVKIPKQGWAISFDAPALSDKKESKKSGDFAFAANSHRFNISLFVEKPRGSGTTNRDWYEYYWSRGSTNPMIDKRSVSFSETDKYARVQYDIVTTFQGKPFRMTNVNYYFIFRDRWVDVHISVSDPRPEDDQIFKTFDASLSYGP